MITHSETTIYFFTHCRAHLSIKSMKSHQYSAIVLVISIICVIFQVVAAQGQGASRKRHEELMQAFDRIETHLEDLRDRKSN